MENGYNCNCGGDCGTRGERNPNAKPSKEDIIFIRKCYGEKLITQKQAYKVVENKISFSTFQSIWQGKSWSSIMPEVYTKENKEYYRKEASIKIVGKISEEQVIELRRKYSNGATARELYENYKNILTYNAFQCILCGRAYKHLPYFHKKTNRWIMPGEEPEKNKSRVQKNKNRRTTGVYTDEEVLFFRKQYILKNYKEIYEHSDKRISLDSFQKMLIGKTYINVPIYSKKRNNGFMKTMLYRLSPNRVSKFTIDT